MLKFLMRDLSSPFWIKFKGALFLFLGLFAAGILIHETKSLYITLLLMVSVWAFCRAYYFAFYVIEKYVDSEFHFSGLGDFLAYLIKRDSKKERPNPPPERTSGSDGRSNP